MPPNTAKGPKATELKKANAGQKCEFCHLSAYEIDFKRLQRLLKANKGQSDMEEDPLEWGK